MKEILDYKYKERPPLETVQIIKDFFNKKIMRYNYMRINLKRIRILVICL